MKTAEEKAYKHLSEAMKGSMGSSMNSFYNGFLAGYNEGQSNPKIKQLEWDGKEELAFFTAKTNIGKYMIDGPRRDGIFMLMYTPDWSYESFFLHASNSIDKLKSIAQQDFEACVKGCLITE